MPVVRFGRVAAMPMEPMPGSRRKPAFLIETKSLGGVSGSPVLFHIDPHYRGKRESLPIDPVSGLVVAPYYLIGMLVGTWSSQYESDLIETDDQASSPKDVEYNIWHLCGYPGLTDCRGARSRVPQKCQNSDTAV